MKVLCIWTMKSLRPPSPAPLQRSHDTQRAACSLHLGSQTPDVGRQASHAKLLRMVPKSLGRMQTFANHTKQRQRTYTKAIKGSAPACKKTLPLPGLRVSRGALVKLPQRSCQEPGTVPPNVGVYDDRHHDNADKRLPIRSSGHYNELQHSFDQNLTAPEMPSHYNAYCCASENRPLCSD